MAEPTPAEAAPPKSRKKLLMVIAAAALVVLGGGAGAYAFLARKPATEADAKGAEAGKEKEPRLPAQFVEMDPPFVVNFGPGSSARFLQIAVQLMTREPHMVHFLEANTPIIRNDLLLLFGNRQVEEVSTNEGREALRAAALETVRKIITAEGGKPEQLEAVYFTSFVMQ